ncbi:MAG: hypothetical protein ACK5ZJ_05310, partial [Acidobacteriota bacterium]
MAGKKRAKPSKRVLSVGFLVIFIFLSQIFCDQYRHRRECAKWACDAASPLLLEVDCVNKDQSQNGKHGDAPSPAWLFSTE